MPQLLVEIEGALDVERVEILFDADSAGRHGARKAARILAPLFPVTIGVLPEGTDPGEWTSAKDWLAVKWITPEALASRLFAEEAGRPAKKSNRQRRRKLV